MGEIRQDPALHIWIDPKKRHIVRVGDDGGDPKELKRMTQYLKEEGLLHGLYRIVVIDDEQNPIRVVRPGES